jgi:hypothetical protein
VRSFSSYKKIRKAVIGRALGESIFTEADTVSELRENVRDAIRCHFNEGEAPTVVKVESHGLCLSQFQAG